MQLQPIIPMKQVLLLSSGLLMTQRVREKMKSKREIEVKRVELNHNEMPTIINEIAHIRFHQTLVLQLNNNNISSIEAIRSINAPNLTELHLSFNHISNLLSLSKVDFPRLKTLGLMNNPIVDGSYLSYMNFPQLTKFLLEEYPSDLHSVRSEIVYLQDCSVFFKIQFIPEVLRRCVSVKRIKQDAIEAMLKLRVPTNRK